MSDQYQVWAIRGTTRLMIKEVPTIEDALAYVRILGGTQYFRIFMPSGAWYENGVGEYPVESK